MALPADPNGQRQFLSHRMSKFQDPFIMARSTFFPEIFSQPPNRASRITNRSCTDSNILSDIDWSSRCSSSVSASTISFTETDSLSVASTSSSWSSWSDSSSGSSCTYSYLPVRDARLSKVPKSINVSVMLDYFQESGSEEAGDNSRSIRRSGHPCRKEYEKDVCDLTSEERKAMVLNLLLAARVVCSFSSSRKKEDCIHHAKNHKKEKRLEFECLVYVPDGIRDCDGQLDVRCSSDCAICSCDYTTGETIAINPQCKHAFHKSCIVDFLVRHNKCPCCETPFLHFASGRKDLDMPLLT